MSLQRRCSTICIKPRGSPSCLTLFRYGVSRNDVSEMIVTGNLVSRATTICILAMLLCLGSRASGQYEAREMGLNGGSNDGSCIEGKCMKRTQDIASGMWFGPRLGKRHRSDEKQEVSPEIEVLANALDGVRWAVITIPANDKRQPSQFTPRLGRGSSEDLPSYGDSYEVDEDDRLLPPILASRLGRRFPWIPSPRLGRQLRNVLRKL
ncbi:PREDICTED: PBAN-type neuropeptides-like isoform X1 [Trachymyrmex cornetzi]|nr:PREDICTED: PBAN-type neuropeptides-like isoform X1 [Trachymyrmex cornetzi]